MEFIKELNELKITQTTYFKELEDIPEKYHKYFENCVKEDLDPKSHRWYTHYTSVFLYEDFLFGVNLCHGNTESQDVEDAFNTLEFFPMKEITVTSYEQIK